MIFKGANGVEIEVQSQATMDVLMARDVFAIKYCKEKEWDIKKLTWEQILEIRSQNEWKNVNEKK